MRSREALLRPRTGKGAWAGVTPRRSRLGRRWLRRVFRSVSLLLGLVLIALVGYSGARLILYDGTFSLHRIEVLGVHRHDPESVGGALKNLEGRNLWSLDPEEVAAGLRGFPWIEGFLCRRHFPDTLILEVRERRELCALRTPSGTWAIDGKGHGWPAPPGETGLFTVADGLDPRDRELQSLAATLLDLGLSGRVVSIAGAEGEASFRLKTRDGWTLTVEEEEVANQWAKYKRAKDWLVIHAPSRKTLDLRWSGKVVLAPEMARLAPASTGEGGSSNG